MVVACSLINSPQSYGWLWLSLWSTHLKVTLVLYDGCGLLSDQLTSKLRMVLAFPVINSPQSCAGTARWLWLALWSTHLKVALVLHDGCGLPCDQLTSKLRWYCTMVVACPLITVARASAASIIRKASWRSLVILKKRRAWRKIMIIKTIQHI